MVEDMTIHLKSNYKLALNPTYIRFYIFISPMIILITVLNALADVRLVDAGLITRPPACLSL